MTATTFSRRAQAGLSIIELMIAITIGLLLLAGLASLFASSSTQQNEMRRGAAQIENGRYAMDTMSQDLQLAGFFGQFRITTAPSTLPDPCLVTTADLTTAINLPIQGYHAASLTSTPDLSATTCPAALTANLSPGSDIIIVRRAETSYVPLSAATVAGERYIQTNPAAIEVQDGGGTAYNGATCNGKADGSASSITRRCLTPSTLTDEICASLCPSGSPVGYIRKLHVHIYFVSPCNVVAGGQTDCTSAADSGTPVPTLKRLELTSSGGSATWQVTAIAEGVEFMTIGYGVDDTPSTLNAETGFIGDGSPDRYVLGPNLSELSNAVTVRLDLLVRNPEKSVNYTDTKTYKLGSDPVAPTTPAVTITSANFDPVYRRHVYNSEIRLVNLSSRRENP